MVVGEDVFPLVAKGKSEEVLERLICSPRPNALPWHGWGACRSCEGSGEAGGDRESGTPSQGHSAQSQLDSVPSSPHTRQEGFSWLCFQRGPLLCPCPHQDSFLQGSCNFRAMEQEWCTCRGWGSTGRVSCNYHPCWCNQGGSCLPPRMAVNAAQHKIVNLLKTLWDFLYDYVSQCIMMCSPRQLFFHCGPETPKGWTPLGKNTEWKGPDVSCNDCWETRAEMLQTHQEIPHRSRQGDQQDSRAPLRLFPPWSHLSVVLVEAACEFTLDRPVPAVPVGPTSLLGHSHSGVAVAPTHRGLLQERQALRRGVNSFHPHLLSLLTSLQVL